MDFACPNEHICYVRCTYCNTLLAVGVPCNWLMDRVTVNCGHCNHLSFLDPCRFSSSRPGLASQGSCIGCWKEHPFLQSSSTSSEQYFSNAPFSLRMPKKHRAPSAYNHFMRDEIHRIKAANPDIPHREAFSTAAKNWAKCDPRNSAKESV